MNELNNINHNHSYFKSAVAFFFLFFIHGTSIGNGQQGISYNVKAFVSGGHRCNFKLTASCPPACTNAVLAAVLL